MKSLSFDTLGNDFIPGQAFSLPLVLRVLILCVLSTTSLRQKLFLVQFFSDKMVRIGGKNS